MEPEKQGGIPFCERDLDAKYFHIPLLVNWYLSVAAALFIWAGFTLPISLGHV